MKGIFFTNNQEKIFQALDKEFKSVTEISNATKIPRSTVNKCLAFLKDRKLVISKKIYEKINSYMQNQQQKLYSQF